MALEGSTPSIRELFRQSIVASGGAGAGEVTHPAGDGLDDDDDDVDVGAADAGAADGGDDDDDDEVEAQPAAVVKKTAVAAKPAEKVGDKTEPTTEDENELISDAEFKALQAQHADDPAALKKSLLGAYTKKTQALATQRRSVQRLEQYAPILDAFEADPEATLRALIEEQGIDIAKWIPATEGTADPGKAKAAADAERASLMTDAQEVLGPELDYLADPLVKLFEKLLERRGPAYVDRAVQPLKQATERLTGKTLQDESASIMTQFETKRPDWKTHEPAMNKLAAQMTPAPGMTELDWLDTLYKVASRDAWEAGRETLVESEVVTRMKKRLAKMGEGTAGDAGAAATPEKQILKRPNGRVSFRQAGKDAFAGKRYDDDDSDDDE